jgi:hypothetical protein
MQSRTASCTRSTSGWCAPHSAGAAAVGEGTAAPGEGVLEGWAAEEEEEEEGAGGLEVAVAATEAVVGVGLAVVVWEEGPSCERAVGAAEKEAEGVSRWCPPLPPASWSSSPATGEACLPFFLSSMMLPSRLL